MLVFQKNETAAMLMCQIKPSYGSSTLLMLISFPEPMCLLVSIKTLSSGIINFQSPRFWQFRSHGACVPWFSWCPEVESMWMRSTKAFNTRWENWESRNLALKEQPYQIFKAKDTWALGTRLFFFVNTYFVPINLHSCWTREWIRSIH